MNIHTRANRTTALVQPGAPDASLILPIATMDGRGMFTQTPNFKPEQTFDPRFIIVHATEGPDDMSSYWSLMDSNRKPDTISAHLMVTRDKGKYPPIVIQMLTLNQRAWHTGISNWGEWGYSPEAIGADGKPRLNPYAIGIEVGNAGPHEAFTPGQYEVLNKVISQIREIYPHIGPQHVLGHSEITPRKKDPGEHFDWTKLAEQGNALWPRPSAPERA